MTDKEKLAEAMKALEAGGKMTEKQADNFFQFCIEGMSRATAADFESQLLHPTYGPIQQTGPACDGCGQPTSNVRHLHDGKTYCCPECRDTVVLREERDRLYVGRAENFELVQALKGDPRSRYDINRELWSIAFYPLWEQDVFEFAYDEFENDVFLVRSYCWDDCICERDEMGRLRGDCTCRVGQPNFVYKPTGLELRWYKYPLRGASVNQRLASYEAICEMVDHCIRSLGK